MFSDLITSLSTRVSPPTVPFGPHATLFSDSLIGPVLSLENIVARTRRAVEAFTATTSLEAVKCTFDRVEAGKLFYQCVYIRLDKDGSPGLLDLHRALRKTFEDATDPKGESYFPHMSLVYGHLTDEQKAALMDGMAQKGEMSTLSKGRHEVAGFSHFETKEILVVKTAGKSDEWEVAARIPLTQALSHAEL